ncbi:hypothetical protein KXW24_007723 [Aspergillus fumigatus]|nr:hypothetical protein KXW24_007723 [Aspergillus fumigatus]
MSAYLSAAIGLAEAAKGPPVLSCHLPSITAVSIWPDGQEAIEWVDQRGLGAAIASLAAADLRTQNYNAILYAYAAPRVANKPLAKFITDQGNNYRFTHRDDPVPKLPLLTMGYVHISPEYYITAADNVTVTEKDVSKA